MNARTWIRSTVRAWFGLALLSMMPAMAAAQEGPPPTASPDVETVRSAVLDLYKTRLRSELQLTDEQADVLMPLVDEIDAFRRDLAGRRSDRQDRLREQLRGGASDADVQESLEALSEIDREQFDGLRERAARIDEPLSVRQRAQWRILSERFRERVERRVQGIRERRGARPGPPERQRSERTP